MRGEHFAKHNPVRGALLRCFASFQSFRSCHHNMNVARFLYQIRLLRFVPRSPFPFRLLHPVSGFVPFLLLQRPCKTLARSPYPFPASLRNVSEYCNSPPASLLLQSPQRGLLLLMLRGILHGFKELPIAKLRTILVIANFKHTNLHIFAKKVISY